MKSHRFLAGHTRLAGSLIVLALAFASGPGRSVAADLTNRYVVKDNSGALAPYDAWANAAANIQTAIDYAQAGETVLVAAATYDTGGVTNYPTGTVLTNRVAIWKAITVRSADNNPTNTLIKGTKDNDTNGPASVRCVYMTNGSALIGFTLTNGATLHVNYPATGSNNNHKGGGIYCQDNTATISNCMIVNNMAALQGGGTYYGTLYNCTLNTNTIITMPVNRSTQGGGASFSILSNCTLTVNGVTADGNQHYGGAAYFGTLYNCTLIGNRALYGAGTYYSDLYYCTVISNKAGYTGGGVRQGNQYNCLIMGNTAGNGGGGGVCEGRQYNCTIVGNQVTGTGTGGGVNTGKLYNCIVYFNEAPSGSNWSNIASNNFTNSCTAPSSDGWAAGNITDNPQFVDTNTANYRLKNISPCINRGTNGSWTTSYPYDLDGHMRIRYGQVDMGAYERFHKGTVCGVH